MIKILMDSSVTTTKCVKCTNAGEFYGLDPKQAIYCKNCFLKMVHHKFSYCLGKYRIFKEAVPQNALILYTDNKASALLLSLICEGLDITSSKRLRIKPSLLFLFTTNNICIIKQQMESICRLLRQFQSQGWKAHFVHVAAVLNPELNFSDDKLIGMEEVENFSSLLRLVKDDSLRRELLRILKTILIVRIARKIGCSRVVLPENAESLANISFNALCFGRGSAICGLTGVIDNSFPDVQLIRPLRDICDKEIQLYHQLHDLSCKFSVSDSSLISENLLTTGDDDVLNEKLSEISFDRGGIQRQTANFISSLQKGGFPATVATILSIAGKVEPPLKTTILQPITSNVDDAICPNGDEKDSDRTDSTCEACFAAISSLNNAYYGVDRPQQLCRSAVNGKMVQLCNPCFYLFSEITINSTPDVYAKFIRILKEL